MCLAIPMKLEKISENFTGTARYGTVSRDVSLALVPEAKVGDYIIIHAGCAIGLLSHEEALDKLDALAELMEKMSGTKDL